MSALHAQLKQAHQQVAAAGPAVSAEHVRAAFKDVMSAVRTDPAVVRRAPPGPADLEREDDAALLEQLHVDLSSNLLGDDPSRGFDQRLADAEAVARRRAALAPGTPVPLVQSGRAGTSPYVDLVAFHRRPPSQTSSPLPPPTPFDFHAVLTFLADYPAVMRMLGLVIRQDSAKARERQGRTAQRRSGRAGAPGPSTGCPVSRSPSSRVDELVSHAPVAVSAERWYVRRARGRSATV